MDFASSNRLGFGRCLSFLLEESILATASFAGSMADSRCPAIAARHTSSSPGSGPLSSSLVAPRRLILRLAMTATAAASPLPPMQPPHGPDAAQTWLSRSVIDVRSRLRSRLRSPVAAGPRPDPAMAVVASRGQLISLVSG
jgi:hypothetical protein